MTFNSELILPILIVAVFFSLPPWRRPYEWPKHVGGYYAI